MANLPAITSTLGLSDLTLLERKKSWGPQLRFTLTWLVELEDGKTLAQSTPGFRYVKRADGEYRILPPVRNSTTETTYYASIVSLDLLKEIEAELIRGGWRRKVGTNNPLKELADMPGDLSTEIPKGKKHR